MIRYTFMTSTKLLESYNSVMSNTNLYYSQFFKSIIWHLYVMQTFGLTRVYTVMTFY